MKRPTTLIEVIERINEKLKSFKTEQGLRGSIRVVRIDSPEAKGPVEVVLDHPSWPNLQAITLREDGTFTGLSYWCDNQI